MAKRCELIPGHEALGAEGWITDSGEVRIEVSGTFTLKKIRCLATAGGIPLPDEDGQITVGPLRITESAGGLVVSTPGAAAGSGAPEALARRYDELLAQGAEMVVATSAGTPPFEAIARHQGSETIIELRIGHEPARRAAAVLAPLLVLRHNPVLGTFALAAEGERLVGRFVVGVDSAAAIALAFRGEVVEPFSMPAQSMSPALLVGDHFFILKDVPARAPERGEIIVHTLDNGQNMVKRVIGLPGDHLVINGDDVAVNGVHLVDVPKGEVFLEDLHNGKPPVHGAGFRETLGEYTYTVMRDGDATDETVDVTVPDGHVFVMGDNRHNSHDSRSLGPISFARIRGRVMVIHWSTGDKGVRWDRLLKVVE